MLTAGIKWPAMKLLERSESILRGDPGGNRTCICPLGEGCSIH